MNKQILSNGFVKLTSTNGITDKRTRQTLTEVVCKAANVKYYTDGEETTEVSADPVSAKVAESNAYAESLKSVSLYGTEIWLTPTERGNYRDTLTAASNNGIESVSYKGMTIAVADALKMLDAVDLWAMQVTLTASAHADAIKTLADDAVADYDYTAGYPAKLVFG